MAVGRGFEIIYESWTRTLVACDDAPGKVGFGEGAGCRQVTTAFGLSQGNSNGNNDDVADVSLANDQAYYPFLFE